MNYFFRDYMGACIEECPVGISAAIIEKKWTTLILRELFSGTKRFSQLQRALAGISKKVLSERLADLEQRGLLSKTIYPSVPPTTEYQLTETGRAFEPVLKAMAEFGVRLMNF